MANPKKKSALDAMEDREYKNDNHRSAAFIGSDSSNIKTKKIGPKKAKAIPVQKKRKTTPGFNFDVDAPKKPIACGGFKFGGKSVPLVLGGSAPKGASPVFGGGGGGVRKARTVKGTFIPPYPWRPVDRSLRLKANRHHLGNGSTLRNLNIVVSKQLAAENDVSVSFGPGAITIHINEIAKIGKF
jgi:hypothetical protein